MHPEPVHKSSSLIGWLADGLTWSDRRMVQSSVSGRGMRTGGRVRMSRPPKGCDPGSLLLVKCHAVMCAVHTHQECTGEARLIGDVRPWWTALCVIAGWRRATPGSSIEVPVVRTHGRAPTIVARETAHTVDACTSPSSLCGLFGELLQGGRGGRKQ